MIRFDTKNFYQLKLGLFYDMEIVSFGLEYCRAVSYATPGKPVPYGIAFHEYLVTVSWYPVLTFKRINM